MQFADALHCHFIGLSGDSALQEHIAGHAMRAGKRLQYRVRLRSFDAICRMIESDVGIGVIPETAALRCQQTMDIKCIRLSDAWASRPSADLSRAILPACLAPPVSSSRNCALVRPESYQGDAARQHARDYLSQMSEVILPVNRSRR